MKAGQSQMAASAAAGILQSNLDEVHAAPAGPSSSKGSTDVIRVMLREQKRECATLHANPLFKEFRDRQRRSSRGQPGHDASAPPFIEDLDAEGQARLTDFIRLTAAELEVAPAGVFASFGKPYACLGELQQLDGSATSLLPHLNRDDLHSSQQQRRPGRRASTQGAAAGGAAAVGAGTAARGSSNEATAAAAGSGTAGASSKDQEAAKLLHHKTVVKFTTADRIEASFPAAAVKQANTRRKAAKAHPHKFFSKKLAEADAADATGSYGARTLVHKQLPGHQLLQRHQAAAAAAAVHGEAAACSHTAGPGSLGAAAAASETMSSRTSIFITQRATAGTATLALQLAAAAASDGAGSAAGSGVASSEEQAPQGNTSPQLSEVGAGGGSSSSRGRAAKHGRLAIAGMSAGSDANAATSAAALSARSTLGANGTARLPVAAAHRMSVTSAADSSSLAAAAAAAAGDEASTVSCSSGRGGPAAAGSSSLPCFNTVTELTMQQPGSADPVTDWHNDFVKVRQAGYTSLQRTLWQRSQARAAARGQADGRAQLSSGLMQSLDAVQGRLAPGWVAGTTPDNPYSIGKQHASAAAAGAEGPAAVGARSVKPPEVELLEHFYDALCGLVERQRLSDPLSLHMVHQVKALLEGGTFLQPQLLQQLVERVAEFVHSCGLLRYNRFALPLLSFVRKCVGVGQVELESMAAAAGILSVLFERCGELREAPAGPGRAEAAAAVGADVGVDGATGVAALSGVAGGSSQAAGVGLDGSCSSSARRSSRLASEAGGCASAAAADAPVPINAAAEAAAADIEQAVQAAPAVQRAAAAAAAAAVSGAASRRSLPSGKSVRVRVPGVAGHVVELSAPSAATGVSAAVAGDAAGGQLVPMLDLKQRPGAGSSSKSSPAAAAAEAAADEVLPDLGDDGCGQSLSRRVRQMQGLQSWSSSGQHQQQLEHQSKHAAQLQEDDGQQDTAEE